MTAALTLVSFIWIIIGTLLILYTAQTKRTIQKLSNIIHVRLLAFLPLAFGIVLVIGAFSQQEIFWLAMITGLIALLKALYLLISSTEKVRKRLDWWYSWAGEVTYRFFGLIIFTLGITLLSYLKV